MFNQKIPKYTYGADFSGYDPDSDEDENNDNDEGEIEEEE